MNIAILSDVSAERARQEVQWGREHSWGFGSCASALVADPVKAMVLGEECGEVARAVLEHNQAGLRRELVQVAAVAIAWLEALEPHTGRGAHGEAE